MSNGNSAGPSCFRAEKGPRGGEKKEGKKETKAIKGNVNMKLMSRREVTSA